MLKQRRTHLYKKLKRARHKDGPLWPAWRRHEAMDDPFENSEDEAGNRDTNGPFRERGLGGLMRLESEDDDYGEELSSYATAVRRATRRINRVCGDGHEKDEDETDAEMPDAIERAEDVDGGGEGRRDVRPNHTAGDGRPSAKADKKRLASSRKVPTNGVHGGGGGGGKAGGKRNAKQQRHRPLRDDDDDDEMDQHHRDSRQRQSSDDEDDQLDDMDRELLGEIDEQPASPEAPPPTSRATERSRTARGGRDGGGKNDNVNGAGASAGASAGAGDGAGDGAGTSAAGSGNRRKGHREEEYQVPKCNPM